MTQKDASNWANLELAAKASQVRKINKQNNVVHSQVKQMLKEAGMIPGEQEAGGAGNGEEEDAISIGNEYNINQQQTGSGPGWLLSVILAGLALAFGLWMGGEGTTVEDLGGAIDTILDFGDPEDIPPEEPTE